MFAKLATVFGLFAVAAQVAVAAPPACLIAAVNTQSNPSDMKTVCTSGASQVQNYMSSNCGNGLEAATSAWNSYCKDAGVYVSASSSSTTATGTKNSSITSTASLPVGTAGSVSSGFLTATANGTYSTPHSSATDSSGASASGASSHAPTATQSGVITSTGAASRLGMDVVGLTVVGIFGAMLAL